MLGLKRGTVKLCKHSPSWKKSFEGEKKKLQKIFDADALTIEHVGSTAISGIPAKPIIDICLVVSSLKIAKNYIKKLEGIGYNLKKENKRERLFFTKGAEEKRTHYLHIGRVNSNYIEEHILFRDYLRRHKNTAKKYAELKKELAEKYQDTREIYTRKKAKFIKQIIKKAKNKN